ncbi:MAG: glycosyltransferase [Selenomonadaceae bacterium]|nr:glycosyltransferase [Selenomonadaceae bacterium]
MDSGNEVLLSVIVPVYNVSQYLPRCMDSLLKQEYPHIEIILVDDGSTDNSGALCDDYAAKYAHVNVIHQANGGLGAARNSGMVAAKGEYIAFVDSDDWVKSSMFSRLMAAAQCYPLAEMIKCGYAETDGQRDKYILFPDISATTLITGDNNLCRYYRQGALWVVAWNTVYKRKLAELVKFPPRLYHEDLYASFLYLYHSRQCVIVNEPLYCYWQNPNSITRDEQHLRQRHRDKLTVMEMLLNFADKQGDLYGTDVYEKLRRSWAREYFHLLRSDKTIKRFSRQTWEDISTNLDWRRRWQLRMLRYHRGITLTEGKGETT